MQVQRVQSPSTIKPLAMRFKYFRSPSQRANPGIAPPAIQHTAPNRTHVVLWIIFAVLATAAILYYRMFIYAP